jgi:hypothetical protein
MGKLRTQEDIEKLRAEVVAYSRKLKADARRWRLHKAAKKKDDYGQRVRRENAKRRKIEAESPQMRAFRERQSARQKQWWIDKRQADQVTEASQLPYRVLRISDGQSEVEEMTP